MKIKEMNAAHSSFSFKSQISKCFLLAQKAFIQSRNLILIAACHQREWKWKWSCLVLSDSWRPPGLQPTRPLCPWDFQGKSTGVGCHCLLQKGKLLESKIIISGVTDGDSSMCSMWPNNSMVWSKALHSLVITEGCPEATWWEQSG